MKADAAYLIKVSTSSAVCLINFHPQIPNDLSRNRESRHYIVNISVF